MARLINETNSIGIDADDFKHLNKIIWRIRLIEELNREVNPKSQGK